MEYHNREKEDQYAYWLHTIPGIGNKKIKLLLEYAGTPEQIYSMGEKELAKIITGNQADKILIHRENFELETEYGKLLSKKIKFIHSGRHEYPERLLQIPDPPFALYVMGDLPAGENKCVAVIGARTCSEYGRYVAGQFGKRLAQAGIDVVSGMAAGIDGISQRAAIEAGGNSYAVLGCGVDICYPKENSDIYSLMACKGGVLSEYPPQTQPRGQNFPPRNRIISGLADAVLVIEAKQKSGTLITVDMALEQGKDVYAVPGRITDALSCGCNYLLKQGAGMILSPEELIEEICSMGTGSGYRCINSINQLHAGGEDSEDDERLLLSVLDDTLKPVSRIYEELMNSGMQSDWTIPALMHCLLKLQLSGSVRQEAGCYCIHRR